MCTACQNRENLELSPADEGKDVIFIDELAGSWVGTMHMKEGHQTVVLEILAIVPQPRGFAVDYRLNLHHLREDGIARVRFDDERNLFRVCFAGKICGWILPDRESGLRIASHPEGDPDLAWELARVTDEISEPVTP